MCLSNFQIPCRRNNFGAELLSFFINCSYDFDAETTNQELSDDHEESLGNITFDTWNVSFINHLWLVAPPSEIIIKTSVFLPVVFWGILANVLLLYVLIKNGHLRSPINLLIGNMAVADLASLLIHPWIMLVYDFFQNYQLGPFGCKAEGAIECALLLTSVASLSAISYDRLTAIVLPQETRLNRKKVKIIMGITWISGFVLAIPLFIHREYRERQWLDFLEKYCTEDTVVINIYWHVIITMMVWLPLSVMLVCYSAILVKLSRYEKKILRKLRTSNVSYKKKVMKTMFIVVLTFMICRLPFTALVFYRNYLLKEKAISKTNQVQNQVNGIYQTLWFVSKYLIFLNAGLNPVIYGSTNEKFRKAFVSTKFYKWLLPHWAAKEQTIPKKKQTRVTAVNSNKSKEAPLKGKTPSTKPTLEGNASATDSSNYQKY